MFKFGYTTKESPKWYHQISAQIHITVTNLNLIDLILGKTKQVTFMLIKKGGNDAKKVLFEVTQFLTLTEEVFVG